MHAIPLSLYIHIPWCVRKCPYCDFNSHVADNSGIPQAQYVDALLRDLEFHLPSIWGRRIVSVFIGGGTPSLFAAEVITRLITGIRALAPCLPGMEVTLEANPGTVEAASFEDFREAGVTRLSLGVQSFDDVALKAIGRIHDGRQASQAVAMAQAAGFDSVNLDLMFGLPGQSLADARRDLELAVASGPQHLSLYQLTIEPNTLFSHRRPAGLPDDDRLADMQEALAEGLRAVGYRRYEVSAYARGDHFCRHNLNYWQFGDYLGLGAGAHSKLSDDGSVRRFSKQRLPRRYLDTAGDEGAVVGLRTLDEADLRLEFMLNALRLREGFSPDLFETHTRLPYAVIEEGIRSGVDRGLLVIDNDRIRTTEKGFRFLSDTQLLFA